MRPLGGERGIPAPSLRFGDAIALIVGIVIGAGIFRTPSVVAANSGSATSMMLAWGAGGLISLIGALCYAELATTYPSAGGEYHYLGRAYGRRIAFLFAWARISVIQTGSIALLSFIFGDYMAAVWPIPGAGAASTAVYAGAAVVVLTLVNLRSVRQGAWTQNVLTTTEIAGLLLVIGAAFLATPASGAITAPVTETPAFGLVMVFVLLTYGGWSEAAYLSAELREPRRQIPRVLLVSIVVITLMYLLVNFAYLRALGLGGMAESSAVGADVVRRAVGEGGARLVSVLIAISALTSANATIFTGARTNYALGRDFAPFAGLGRWSERFGTPANALLVQGAVALALVMLGAGTRRGFETMVEYTAPVFWFFLMLVGVAVFVLRHREPDRERPFRVPLYPLTPFLFVVTSSYLLYSSLAYTRGGAAVGVVVLLVGAAVLFFTRRSHP